MSVLALASVLSLALFRSFGPSAAILPSDRTDEDSPDLSELKTNVPSNTGEPFSLWHHLPVSQLGPTGPVAAVSSPASIKTLSPTAPVLGSAIRDNALTTNPVKAGNVEPCAHSDSASVPHRKRRDVMASMSCCSLSIRDSQVALTTVTTALSTTDGSWSKTWRKKIMREPTSIAIVNVTAPAPARQCTLSQHVRSEMMAQFTAISAPAMTFAISASRYLNHVYAPALAELQKELAELLALAHAIAETTSTLSQLVINRAARGFSISRQALHSATSRLPKYASPSNSMTEASRIMSNHTAIWDAVVIARDSVDALSDYMEDHAAALSDFVEDQAIVIQEKGIKSLRRAKQGLNKLIAEAKKLKGDPGEEKVGRTDVGKEGPMPFTRMHRRAGRAPFARTSRLVSSRLQPRQRHSRRAERCIKRTLPPPETPSRSRRFWDMVHHVSLQGHVFNDELTYRRVSSPLFYNPRWRSPV